VRVMRRFVLARVGESLVEDAMGSSETRESVGVDVTSTVRDQSLARMKCVARLFIPIGI
jgi:hypothetical protein